MSDRLFTARFFIMCAYSFTVFVSVFQLLPTAPYHILDLGGSIAVAGLFQGVLTYSSAFSASITGTLGDRLGQRRVLVTVSLVLAGFSSSYAFIHRIPLLLLVVFFHGLFWSALLSASGAYMTGTIPEARRAEGISYWGLTSALAIAVAPAVGFSIYRHGWDALCVVLVVLNLVMAVIAWRLPDDRDRSHASDAHASAPHGSIIEWRVLALSITMSLISFGYGALTSFSAMFADEVQIHPRSLFLTTAALTIVAGRLTVGRTLDEVGYRRVLVPCLAVPAVGLALLAVAHARPMVVLSAFVFGAGFGLMYPAYTSYIMRHVHFSRRGAAFGAMLAAFDTGIGTGSSVVGWLIDRTGFRGAFAIAAGIAALALPYFLVAERKLGFSGDGREAGTSPS
jgi:MFS family permease